MSLIDNNNFFDSTNRYQNNNININNEELKNGGDIIQEKTNIYKNDINNIINNVNNNNINESHDSKQNFNQYINTLLDNMGFTRYHLFLFLTNAVFLFCAGMQEIIHVILLSIINDTYKLTYYHLAFMNSIEYLGYTFSTIFINIITQYISRKKSIQIVMIFSLIFTGLSLTTYNFYFAAFNRLFLGFCLGILDILIYLNLFESVPTKIRGFLSSLILLFFPLGEFVFSVVCYFQLTEGDHKLNYKMLLLIPFFVTCIITLLVIIIIHESPRNLFGENKFQEGVETIKRISSFNKEKDDYLENKFNFNKLLPKKLNTIEQANLNDIEGTNIVSRNKKINKTYLKYNSVKEKQFNFDKFDEYLNENKEKILNESNISIKNGVKNLFNEKYFHYSLLFWVCASFSGFIFNGIYFMLPATAPKINKNTFFDLIIFEGMEIPSNFIASLLIENKNIGRLMLLRIGFILTFLISLINISMETTVLLFECFLKFFLTIPLNVLLIYCSEIYESDVRTMGVSLIIFWRRIASLFSPFFMSYLTINYGDYYTYFVYSPLLCVCAICVLYFDTESRGIPLDEIMHVNVK